MAQYYSVEFEGIAVTAIQDFFQLTCADDRPIEIVSAMIGQYSDLGDSEEEGLRLQIIRGHATTGSGGGTATPRPLNPNYSAAGFACQINNTTIASAGSPVNMWSEPFNNRIGWFFFPVPEARIVANQASLLVVRLLAAPLDELSMSGSLVIKEY